jgi:hypothetical protein
MLWKFYSDGCKYPIIHQRKYDVEVLRRMLVRSGLKIDIDIELPSQHINLKYEKEYDNLDFFDFHACFIACQKQVFRLIFDAFPDFLNSIHHNEGFFIDGFSSLKIISPPEVCLAESKTTTDSKIIVLQGKRVNLVRNFQEIVNNNLFFCISKTGAIGCGEIFKKFCEDEKLTNIFFERLI